MQTLNKIPGGAYQVVINDINSATLLLLRYAASGRKAAFVGITVEKRCKHNNL